EKSSEAINQVGVGNNADKPDNLGKGDADTVETAVTLDDKATTIYFKITNNGSEPLTQIQATDKTIDGKQDVKALKWTYKDKVLTINKSGEFELDGKLLVLQVGEFISGTGTLDKLAEGETHADEITVSAVGVTSGTKVGDKDKWHAKRDAALPKTDAPKGTLPMTGEQKAALMTGLGFTIIVFVGYFKRYAIAKKVRRFRR
ncbi:LPXTG cell wall anchor domain-containing protein, partial [Pseudolactococcus yaeyamensis]